MIQSEVSTFAIVVIFSVVVCLRCCTIFCYLLYIHIYIYMNLYYMYMHMFMYVYVYVCVYTYLSLYVSVYTYIYITSKMLYRYVRPSVCLKLSQFSCIFYLIYGIVFVQLTCLGLGHETMVCAVCCLYSYSYDSLVNVYVILLSLWKIMRCFFRPSTFL